MSSWSATNYLTIGPLPSVRQIPKDFKDLLLKKSLSCCFSIDLILSIDDTAAFCLGLIEMTKEAGQLCSSLLVNSIINLCEPDLGTFVYLCAELCSSPIQGQLLQQVCQH